MLGLSGCSGDAGRAPQGQKNSAPNIHEATPTNASVPAIVETSESFSVIQRTTTTVPAPDGEIELTLGDITGGRVQVSIATTVGAVIVAPRFVSAGDEIEFAHREGEYRLKLDRFHAKLVGEDRADFTLAVRRPADAVGAHSPPTMSEPERIDALIAAVAGLEDAIFIRNGTEYPARDAADHLRMKRERAGDRIATAEQFIEGIASRSSITGRPYLIRFADGREVEAGPWLREQLAALDSPNAAKDNKP